MFVYRGEGLCTLLVLAIVALLALLENLGGAVVIWSVFSGAFFVFLALIGVGLVMRPLNVGPHTATTLIAFGLFPIFANLFAILTYTAFPLNRPLIDAHLFRIDAWFGYDWEAAVTWQAAHPEFSLFLARVYTSSLFQIGLLLLVLGAMGRVVPLHRMLLTGAISVCLTFGFWLVFPSFGPAAYFDLPEEVVARASLVVTPEYGDQLRALAEHGLSGVETLTLLGTVAFPSFHIVMAGLVVWFSRGTLLFWPLLLLNVPMVPATLTHGGHHLADLFGGVVVFALAAAAAGRLLPDGEARRINFSRAPIKLTAEPSVLRTDR